MHYTVSKVIELFDNAMALEEKNKGLKITFSSFKEEFNNRIKILLNSEQIRELIGHLETYITKPVKKEIVAYTDDISTYKDEVERTMGITGKHGLLQLSLDCYTDKPFDDNWIVLTPAKLSKFVGLLYGYLPKGIK